MTDVPASRKIGTPADLASLIREIKAAIATGVLEQVQPDASPFATDADIGGLAEQGPWPDYIEMRFRVRSTGTRYKLVVETYHGAGGAWAPD